MSSDLIQRVTKPQKITGEPCNILTYEKSELQAMFGGWHPDGTEILVRDLKTPARDTLPSALLRTPDIIAVQFDRPLQLT